MMTKTLYLIGVIGAGDQQENPGEGVLGWVGDLPGLRAWMKNEKSYQILLFFKLHQQTDVIILYVNILINDVSASRY